MGLYYTTNHPDFVASLERWCESQPMITDFTWRTHTLLSQRGDVRATEMRTPGQYKVFTFDLRGITPNSMDVLLSQFLKVQSLALPSTLVHLYISLLI